MPQGLKAGGGTRERVGVSRRKEGRKGLGLRLHVYFDAGRQGHTLGHKTLSGSVGRKILGIQLSNPLVLRPSVCLSVCLSLCLSGSLAVSG